MDETVSWKFASPTKLKTEDVEASFPERGGMKLDALALSSKADEYTKPILIGTVHITSTAYENKQHNWWICPESFPLLSPGTGDLCRRYQHSSRPTNNLDRTKSCSSLMQQTLKGVLARFRHHPDTGITTCLGTRTCLLSYATACCPNTLLHTGVMLCNKHAAKV